MGGDCEVVSLKAYRMKANLLFGMFFWLVLVFAVGLPEKAN